METLQKYIYFLFILAVKRFVHSSSSCAPVGIRVCPSLSRKTERKCSVMEALSTVPVFLLVSEELWSSAVVELQRW